VVRAIGRVRRVVGVGIAVAAVAAGAIVLGGCGGGSSHASGSTTSMPAQLIGRFPAGVASLSWHANGSSLTGTMTVAETTPSSPLNLVRQRTNVTGSLHGSDVSLDPGGGAEPWTGTLDGTTLTLTWSPNATGNVTTIFTPGSDANFTADVQSYQHDVNAAQQAAAASLAQQAQKQAAANAAAQARLAAHDAQVAAMQAAHQAKVDAQRQKYDAAAAHAAAERAAQAKAAAHHP